MKKTRKRAILFSLFLCMGLFLCTAQAKAAQQPTLENVYVKGTALKGYLKDHPGMGSVYIDDNGRAMVPLRALTETMGLDVNWDGQSERITISGANGPVVFSVGSSAYTVGGQTMHMDTAPVMKEGRAHLPVRFAAESVGAQVYYVAADPKKARNFPWVEIYYHANDVTPEAPDWADGDYVTFERTNAYLPENWAVITDLRRRAAAGEDVGKELGDFCGRFACTGGGVRYYDPGIRYEEVMISAMLLLHHPKEELQGYRGNIYSDYQYTPEQKNSLYRWELRSMGACSVNGSTRDAVQGKIYDLYFPSRRLVKYGGCADRYEPDATAVLGKSVKEFLAEPWFAHTGLDTVEPIFFDRYCFSPAHFFAEKDMVYRSNGVTMVDLEVIGASLSLKRGWNDPSKTATGLQWKELAQDDSGVTSVTIEDWFGREIKLTRGSADAVLDGKKIPLGKPVEGDKTRLYVPIRFLSDVLGEKVTYDEERGIYFVERDPQVSDESLVRWALGMSAVLVADNQNDPYYFGFNNRCMSTMEKEKPSAYNSEWPETYYVYYPNYYMSYMQLATQWGCTSADDIKSQAALLVENAETIEYPAWHLFRVAHIATGGYSWGYLTGEEAAQLVQPAAEALKRHYNSWDEATEDYLTGYVNVFGGSAEVAARRRQVYQKLKAEQSKYGLLFDDTLFRT